MAKSTAQKFRDGEWVVLRKRSALISKAYVAFRGAGFEVLIRIACNQYLQSVHIPWRIVEAALAARPKRKPRKGAK